MIISDPNEFVAEVHDRMPVLLKPDLQRPGSDATPEDQRKSKH
jgi:putative SOS response-associated peptidase YedK